MRPKQRSIALILTCIWVTAFQFGPDVLGLNAADRITWLSVPGVLSPLMAAIACFWAAQRSDGGDRTAWRYFGAGSCLYLFGNLCYVYFGLYNIDTPFPTVPEFSFFLMAVLFTAGMFEYGAAKRLVSRIQVYNFGLIFCAAAISAIFLLHDSVASSVLTAFGTVFAVAYPVLWFSVAGFGLVCLLLYSHERKRFAFTLLLFAILAEATADFVYAQGLMAGTYQPGGVTSALWLSTTILLVWAAVEQVYLGKLGATATTNVLTLGRRQLAEASVPGVAVAAVLVSALVGGLSSDFSDTFVFALPMAALFAALVGIREHWTLSIERDLKDAAGKSEIELATSQQRLTSVLESTTDSVIVLDRHWRIVFFNSQARRSVGSSVPLMLGRYLSDLFPKDVVVNLEERFEEALAAGAAVDFEQFLPDRTIWLEVHAFPSPEGLSVFFRDISEARRIREDITYLAHHDPLTGLANRAVFQETLRKCLGEGQKTATLLLDLDHFKEVNDTLGHPVGDALLCLLAKRLRMCVGDTNTVGRLGGDEFAVIQAGVASAADAARTAQNILDSACAPYVIDGQTVYVGASIGIALSPADGLDPDQIFRNADIALYAAKAEGRGTFRFFEPAMAALLQTRQKLKADLALALDAGELRVVYQPIVDLSFNVVTSFEALLRWNHPVHHAIPPSVFIPIAEETGMIVAIGAWVLAQACVEAAKWPGTISVAVNVSTVQFAASNLTHIVRNALEASGLSPERLELEITESALLQDSATNLATLERLRTLGISIALDDFGTGYASLGYLQKFPFNRIKVDRAFVINLPKRPDSQAIVSAVTGLGHALGMLITAEGVETRQQLDHVREVGCDEAQGFFFQRAVEATEVPDLLDKLQATQKFWGDPTRPRGRAALPTRPASSS